jgi:excisionase family DNA binding protein
LLAAKEGPMEPAKIYQNCAILYVDDEETSLKYFRRAFQHRFTIMSAANAADAYQLLVEHHDEIGVLITDQRMPGEKGTEFLQRAQQLHPNAIRILTTAYSDFDAITDAINLSSIAKYVTKPWDIPELEVILKGACDRYLQERERRPSDADPRQKPSRLVTIASDAGSGSLQTLDDIAHYLNVDKFTVYRLVTRNKLPAFKVGNQWRFKKELIDAWLEARSNIPGSKSS